MAGPLAIDLAAYRRRIGHTGPTDPTLATLAQLIACHARSISFENIDVLARRVPALDLGSLQGKLVARRRGGYCYEQNSLFMAVLEALGFEVHALEARVRVSALPGEVTPRTHMALRVTLAGQDHLVDVGFGGQAPLAPLRLNDSEAQHAPGSVYRWVATPRERLLQIQGSQGWSDCYSVIDGELHSPDREVGNWYAGTHPAFPLALNLSLGRATEAGRLVVWNTQLTTRIHATGQVHESAIASRAELGDVLTEGFGLELGPADVDTAWGVARRATEQAAAGATNRSGNAA
jgi:N-hydroxyarylamine O-acetyltransferase